MGPCGASKLLLILVVSAYVFSWSAEALCWSCVAGPNSKPGRKIPITVWKKGFNYQDWVDKFFPLQVNDVLVFKYNKNLKKNSTVYLMPDMESILSCNLKKARKLGAKGKGSSQGFRFLLRTTQPYTFASGNRYDCKHYNMQFNVAAWPIE